MPHSFPGANLQGIRDAAERTEAARGLRRLEDLLGLLDLRSESPGETRTRLALVAAGLPAPRLQFEIPTAEGVFRADFAWPELMVILEFDGESKYFDYRPTPDVLLAERRRENALVVEGWTLVRARWADLSNPGVVPARVLAAFERARRLAAEVGPREAVPRRHDRPAETTVEPPTDGLTANAHWLPSARPPALPRPGPRPPAPRPGADPSRRACPR